MVDLDKTTVGLGLSLAGHRDRSKLSVFVVGLQPDTSAAAASDKIRIGDELLEVSCCLIVLTIFFWHNPITVICHKAFYIPSPFLYQCIYSNLHVQSIHGNASSSVYVQ